MAVKRTVPGAAHRLIDQLGSIDAELIANAAAGDQRAFDHLYDALFPLVWSLSVQRVGLSLQEAERLTERILERVVLSLDGYERTLPFARWLRDVIAQEVRGFGRAPRRRAGVTSKRSTVQPQT